MESIKRKFELSEIGAENGGRETIDNSDNSDNDSDTESSLIFRTEFAVIHRKVNTKVTSTESPNLSHG